MFFRYILGIIAYSGGDMQKKLLIVVGSIFLLTNASVSEKIIRIKQYKKTVAITGTVCIVFFFYFLYKKKYQRNKANFNKKTTTTANVNTENNSANPNNNGQLVTQNVSKNQIEVNRKSRVTQSLTNILIDLEQKVENILPSYPLDYYKQIDEDRKKQLIFGYLTENEVWDKFAQRYKVETLWPNFFNKVIQIERKNKNFLDITHFDFLLKDFIQDKEKMKLLKKENLLLDYIDSDLFDNKTIINNFLAIDLLTENTLAQRIADKIYNNRDSLIQALDPQKNSDFLPAVLDSYKQNIENIVNNRKMIEDVPDND